MENDRIGPSFRIKSKPVLISPPYESFLYAATPELFGHHTASELIRGV